MWTIIAVDMFIQDMECLNHQRYKISHIEVTTTCNIRITASNMRVCHIFFYQISSFLSHLVEMHPHMVTLRNFDGTHLLDCDLFYICTKF